MPIQYKKFISRQMVQGNPETLFVFGDNVKRSGHRGQAAQMRGEPNTIGIPTKWYPTLKTDAFFYDHQIDQIRPLMEADYLTVENHLLNGKTVIWPADNIGTGLSRIPSNAPILWQWMEEVRTYFDQIV